MSEKQESLFGWGEDWHDEWRGMPEFIQERRDPYSLVTVRFRNQDDLDDFASKIGQAMTQKTRSIWYPPLGESEHSKWVYVDD